MTLSLSPFSPYKSLPFDSLNIKSSLSKFVIVVNRYFRPYFILYINFTINPQNYIDLLTFYIYNILDEDDTIKAGDDIVWIPL
jgi:hypothetical protein